MSDQGIIFISKPCPEIAKFHGKPATKYPKCHCGTRHQMTLLCLYKSAQGSICFKSFNINKKSRFDRWKYVHLKSHKEKDEN